MKGRLFFTMITFLFVNAGTVFTKSSYFELSKIPPDSLDAMNLKIWIPVERSPRKRVQVDIRSRSGMITRRLYTGYLSKGYHNLYWDKKDDSGRYVPEGIYRYQAQIGRQSRFGELEVKYRRGERESELYPVEEKRPKELYFLLKKDSARVTITIINPRGDTLAVPVCDSLMPAGKHPFRWQPTDRICPPLYGVKVRVEEQLWPSIVLYAE